MPLAMYLNPDYRLNYVNRFPMHVHPVKDDGHGIGPRELGDWARKYYYMWTKEDTPTSCSES